MKCRGVVELVCLALFALMLIGGCATTSDAPRPDDPSLIALPGVSSIAILPLNCHNPDAAWKTAKKISEVMAEKGSFAIISADEVKKALQTEKSVVE
jgi:hypothetical protein